MKQQFGYRKLRQFGVALWCVSTLAGAIGALYFEIYPFSYLTTMPAFVDNVVVLNIVAVLLAWLAINAPFILLWWLVRKVRFWFSHL